MWSYIHLREVHIPVNSLCFSHCCLLHKEVQIEDESTTELAMKLKLTHCRKCLLKVKWNNLWFLFLKMALLFNVITFLPVTAFLFSLPSTLSLWLVENSVKYNILSTNLFIDVVWCQAGHCGCDSLKLSVWIVIVEGLISQDTGDLCFPVHYLCFFSPLLFLLRSIS